MLKTLLVARYNDTLNICVQFICNAIFLHAIYSPHFVIVIIIILITQRDSYVSSKSKN